jgi:hypothetical protein
MSVDQQELEAASEANNIARVRELFATKPSNDDDTNRFSFNPPPCRPLQRCLVEHRPDLARGLLVGSPPSLDMIKLFVEFGYFDVKAEGHKLLQ